MPTFVNPTACNACEGEHQGPLCVYRGTAIAPISGSNVL